MGCGRRERWSRWVEAARQHAREHGHGDGRWFGCHRQRERAPSGNRAFDEYRAETLRRLEEEQREFQEFLDRLRMAKDKAEFDQFFEQRRHRPEEGPEPPPQAQP